MSKAKSNPTKICKCPKCGAKVKDDEWGYKCKRCGWSKALEPTNLTKRFLGFL